MRTSKIKAVLCDFDGTLVNKNSEDYTSGVPDLVSKLKQKKVRFSLATGRGYFGKVKKVINSLGVNDIHIFNGGGMLRDTRTGKLIYYQPISKSSVKEIAGFFVERKLTFTLETKESAYLYPITANPSYLKGVEIIDFKKYDGTEDVMKMVLFVEGNNLDEKTIIDISKKISGFSKDVDMTRFNFHGKFGLDITSEKATKHTAILEYIKLLSLKPDELVGIGDSYNDYPLFTACGFRIAMNNAPDHLKEIADLVVPPVEDGGMEEALKYILDNLV